MRTHSHSPCLVAAALMTCVAACDAGSSSTIPTTPDAAFGPGSDAGVEPDPTTPADPAALGPEASKVLERIQAESAATEDLTSEELLEASALEHTTLSYDPITAEHMPLIQGSSLALDDAALGVLQDKGFVLDASQSFPTFLYGYQAIYANDLPLYVSADSVLDAVHRGYDEILLMVERSSLRDEVKSLLEEAQAALRGGAGSGYGAEAVADAEQYLEVARVLLDGDAQPTLMLGGSTDDVTNLVAKATQGGMLEQVPLFGEPRELDFSQFKPRGHYTDEESMQRYFRAMMWLGRVDLRMVETLRDGTQVLRRRQLKATLALGQALDGEVRERWLRINDVLEVFVGGSDSLTPASVPDLASALGVSDAAGLDAQTDDAVIGTILQGGFGAQRILSHFVINGPDSGTLPLNSSFLVMGQRYVVDSHVLSNVVWDRTKSKRMMPDPLDAAYAALGNDQAASLLQQDLEAHGYAPNLHMTRFMVDAYEPEFWETSLYNRWLASLRALSPVPSEVSDPAAVGMPQVTGTEPWGRRMLNTQLGSWSQLRHDTLLYAKQSYTSGAACEYPDAYVDPYPQVFEHLQHYAQAGLQLHTTLSALTHEPYLLELLQGYFSSLEKTTGILKDMATAQRQGVPFTEAQMAFINDAVVVNIEEGCVRVEIPDGWYARLFPEEAKSLEYDPVIADVHTQPTDEAGNVVGKVLHVGTALPRLMVVTADTCEGPRAYVGLAFAYHERVTEEFERLTDEQWAADVMRSPPPEVPWLEDVVAP